MDILIAISIGIALLALLVGWVWFCVRNPGTASMLWIISALLGGE